MDELQFFLSNLLEKYPETWSNIDDYIKYMMPNEINDPFTFKSKYYKEFIPKVEGKKIIFISKEKASLEDTEKYKGLFNTHLIDFEELFKDCNKNNFDIESWSDERIEKTTKQINEFLFECNIFKGIFFFSKLSEVFAEITSVLDNLETITPIYSDKPNWLQIEIKEKLKLEVESLKNILVSSFESIYPKLNHVMNRKDLPDFSEKILSFNWYKIASIMAEGYLEIKENHYIVNGAEVYNESKAARLVSSYLFGTPSNFEKIKPYLNQTKSCTKNNNKNIFIESRIDTLNSLAASAAQNNILSEYFNTKLSKLNKERDL